MYELLCVVNPVLWMILEIMLFYQLCYVELCVETPKTKRLYLYENGIHFL